MRTVKLFLLFGLLMLSLSRGLRADPLVIPAARLQEGGVRLEYPRGDKGTRFLQVVGVDLPKIRSLGMELEAESPTQIGIYLVWPDGTTRWRYVVFTPLSMKKSLRLSVDAFDPEPSAKWSQVPAGGTLIFSYQPAFRKLSPRGFLRIKGLQFSSQELPLPPEQVAASASRELTGPAREDFSRILACWQGKALGGRAGMSREGDDEPDWTALEASPESGEEAWRELVPPREYGFGPDDDSTLGVGSLFLAEKLGRVPHPSEIAMYWLGEVPPEFHWFNSWNALKRFRQGKRPPETGKGPLGETLSSRIRVDPWGMVFPRDPKRAGEVAAADASLNSFGHGIEDARFVAAVISRAFSGGTLDQVWDAGLEGIEGEFREAALAGRRARVQGVSLRAAYDQVRERFFIPLKKLHGKRAWVFSVPNVALMGVAVAYGEEDPVRILRLASYLGWDSDCNAGTLGALLGAWKGEGAFSSGLVDSLGDRLRVALPGQEHLSLRALARRTLALSMRISGASRLDSGD